MATPNPDSPTDTPSLLVQQAQRITNAGWFRHGITAVIVLNAIVIGMDTVQQLHDPYGAAFHAVNQVVLGIFIVEALIKMLALYPRVYGYFRDGWNVFDFVIIVFSLVPMTGEVATIARVARVLRVLRLVSILPELRMLVSALIRSLPGMLHVMLLVFIVFYVYAVAGFHLFHEIDPTHWRSLGISLLSLFRIVTLEDWTDIMYVAMEHFWWAWIFFVSFVVLGTFIVINLFIGVVINNLDDAKREHLRELQADVSNHELLSEMVKTKEMLERLESRLRSSI